MLVKARKDKNNEWGILEKYECYSFKGKGYVKALTSVTMNGELSPVYAFRGNEFIPLKEIDTEVGIDRYVKAKKPFYTKSGEGFIVILIARLDFKNHKVLLEDSEYEVYTLNGNQFDLEVGLPFKKVLDVPKEFADIVKEPLRLLGESFGDREVFLRSRIKEWEK